MIICSGKKQMLLNRMMPTYVEGWPRSLAKITDYPPKMIILPNVVKSIVNFSN